MAAADAGLTPPEAVLPERVAPSLLVEEQGQSSPPLPSSSQVRKRPKTKEDVPRADMGAGAYYVDRVRSVSSGKEGLQGNQPLSQEQEAVVQVCLAGHNVCITGEAGTGKSHLLRALIQRLRLKHNFRGVYCTATTGIA